MKRAIIETMLSIYALKEQVLRLFILCKIKPMLSFVNQKQFAFLRTSGIHEHRPNYLLILSIYLENCAYVNLHVDYAGNAIQPPLPPAENSKKNVPA